MRWHPEQTVAWTASLGEYLQRVWQRGWAVIVSGVGGVLGLISLTVPSSGGSHPQPLISAWIWGPLLVGGVTIAQFLAFHDVRRERDEARSELQIRLDALRFRLDMTRLQPNAARMPVAGADQPQPGFSFWLTFTNGAAEVMEYEIETLSIVIEGRTTQEPLSSRVGIILPGRESQYHYPWLACPTKEVLDGMCEYLIVYRHPTGGRPSFRTHAKFTVGITVGETAIKTAWVVEGAISHDLVEES
jgi:hypothetical protein